MQSIDNHPKKQINYADMPDRFTGKDGLIYRKLDKYQGFRRYRSEKDASTDNHNAALLTDEEGEVLPGEIQQETVSYLVALAQYLPAEPVEKQTHQQLDTVTENASQPSRGTDALLDDLCADLHRAEQKTKEQASTVEQESCDDEDSPARSTDSFPDEVFDNLPQAMKTPCDILVSATEREVFLVGAIGLISGILPHVYGVYDGKEVGTNLYAYVLAPYGTGKGALTYAYQLGAEIHQQLRAQAEEDRQEHEAACTTYEKQLADFRKAKGAAEPPVKPTPPKNRMLIIPANNSKTGAIQLLDDNDQRGILFETEADTLADAMNQDYGNFSDALRAAFHHERVSYNRRGNGGELVDMEHPQLSVVLSSTPDQLLKLIPTAVNGLFSRFLYYNAPPDHTFRNVFDKRKRSYDQAFKAAGNEFLGIYNWLCKRDGSPIEIRLTDDQQISFVSHFSATKASIYNEYDENLGGTVNRLALICFRLCMIFTTLRAFESGEEPTTTLVCSEVDFVNAVNIVNVLTRHALIVHELLPRHHSAEKKDRDTLKYEGIKAAETNGVFWETIAKDWGFNSKQAANAWYKRAHAKFSK